MVNKKSLLRLMVFVLILAFFAVPQYSLGKDSFSPPKEYGFYVKTGKGLIRLTTNIVFDEKGILYIEHNNPPHFLLKDIDFFVVHGKYDLDFLTLNPLFFFQPSPFGKSRYIFGKDIPFEIRKKGPDIYTVKPKSMISRGYFTFWINDSAWDFIIE